MVPPLESFLYLICAMPRETRVLVVFLCAVSHQMFAELEGNIFKQEMPIPASKLSVCWLLQIGWDVLM